MSSESTDLTMSPATPPTTVDAPVGKPTGEAAVLAGVQSVLTNPTTVKAARGLSHFGEHSLGWLALAGAGAAIASRRGNETAQRRYIEAGVGAFGAHAASVIIKRIVRRPRPDHPARPRRQPGQRRRPGGTDDATGRAREDSILALEQMRVDEPAIALHEHQPDITGGGSYPIDIGAQDG